MSEGSLTSIALGNSTTASVNGEEPRSLERQIETDQEQCAYQRRFVNNSSEAVNAMGSDNSECTRFPPECLLEIFPVHRPILRNGEDYSLRQKISSA